MKKTGFSLMLGCVLQISLAAQPASTNTSAPAASLPPTVLARSASSRVWARIASVTNDAGEVSLVTKEAYTEVASGLCYQNRSNGEWVDSVEEIEVDNVAGGASARQAPHKVHFANNANTAGGAIHLIASDGKVFDSRVYGLAYWDIVSGSNLLLAPLQDCQGVIVGKNRVLYTNAFHGLNADLEYIVTKSGLEQNVILREWPPTPDSLGLDPETSRLQVLTEFFDPATPVIRSRMVNNVEDDAHLDFGAMMIGVGRAFLAQGQDTPNIPGSGIVLKRWGRMGGRDFLIEEIPYATVAQSLQALPRHASAAPIAPAIKHLAALEPLLPREASRKGPSLPMRTAQAMPSRPGLVVDYVVVNGGGPPGNVFQSDTTYLIAGPVYIVSPTCFEGGAVIKFPYVTYQNLSYPMMNESAAPFNFAGSAYRPTVFTESDDNSVGDTISGSSGNPTPCNYPFLLEDTYGATTATVAHARFAYGLIAYGTGGSSVTSLVFQDCQFLQFGFSAIYWPPSCSVHLLNDLFTGCGSVVGCGQSITVDAENITADRIGAFVYPYTPSCGGGITNSILSNVTNQNSFGQITFNDTYFVNSSAYQTVGDGHYYLANGSGYRHAGTANINSALLAELGTKTTWPPTNVYANQTISTPTTLGPAIPRENITQPDLGYAYDPLDYVFGGTTVNANITFTAGTAVGWFKGSGTDYGIRMSNSQIASFQGTVTSPVWWVRGNTVQEQGGNVVWPGAGATGGLVGEAGSFAQSPQANLFFTHCSILGLGDCGRLNHFRDDGGYLIVNAEHSEFYGGACGSNAISCYFTNCLLDRVLLAQVQGWPGNAFILTNCTFHAGSLNLTPNSTPIPIYIHDCAFDGTSLLVSYYGTNSTYANYNYNAFTNTAGKFPIGGTNDQIVTSGFNWQTSWFGNYYLPSGSPLTNAGDLTANVVGLYHFTTQANQVPETNSIVDIGYHYVATDANGNPLNSNGNGIPDYLQDAKGDGLFDAGDPSNWLPCVADTNGWIRLLIYTPMQ